MGDRQPTPSPSRVPFQGPLAHPTKLVSTAGRLPLIHSTHCSFMYTQSLHCNVHAAAAIT